MHLPSPCQERACDFAGRWHWLCQLRDRHRFGLTAQQCERPSVFDSTDLTGPVEMVAWNRPSPHAISHFPQCWCPSEVHDDEECPNATSWGQVLHVGFVGFFGVQDPKPKKQPKEPCSRLARGPTHYFMNIL